MIIKFGSIILLLIKFSMSHDNHYSHLVNNTKDIIYIIDFGGL